jgi:alkaline phosphatase
MDTIIKFGIVTDLHYAELKPAENRYFEQSMSKLHEAVTVFNRRPLDFVIELGDFKDMGRAPDRKQTISFLKKIEHTLQEFNGPVYHALGNHDMDSISKADFLENTENKGPEGSGDVRGKTHYAFIQRGIKFIVLDANFNEDGSDYNQGNFDWVKAFIPDSQRLWLEKELNDACPAVIFVHQLLDSFSGVDPHVCIRNAAGIVDVLERSGHVLAVFQGHHHEGHYSSRNGIQYFTIKGMIEGPFPENNSFVIVHVDQSFKVSMSKTAGRQ